MTTQLVKDITLNSVIHDHVDDIANLNISIDQLSKTIDNIDISNMASNIDVNARFKNLEASFNSETSVEDVYKLVEQLALLLNCKIYGDEEDLSDTLSTTAIITPVGNKSESEKNTYVEIVGYQSTTTYVKHDNKIIKSSGKMPICLTFEQHGPNTLTLSNFDYIPLVAYGSIDVQNPTQQMIDNDSKTIIAYAGGTFEYIDSPNINIPDYKKSQVRLIKLSNKLTSLSNIDFKQFSNLIGVVFPITSDINTIPSETFTNLKSLQLLNIPKYIKNIEENAIHDCKNIAFISYYASNDANIADGWIDDTQCIYEISNDTMPEETENNINALNNINVFELFSAKGKDDYCDDCEPIVRSEGIKYSKWSKWNRYNFRVIDSDTSYIHFPNLNHYVITTTYKCDKKRTRRISEKIFYQACIDGACTNWTKNIPKGTQTQTGSDTWTETVTYYNNKPIDKPMISDQKETKNEPTTTSPDNMSLNPIQSL